MRYHVQALTQAVHPPEWRTIIQRDSLDEAIDLQEHYRSTYPTWTVRVYDSQTEAFLDAMKFGVDSDELIIER